MSAVHRPGVAQAPAPNVAAPREALQEAYYLASQWRLMWRKFSRHRLALVGMIVLSLLYLAAAFGGFVSPYHPGAFSDHPFTPPQRVRFVDADGRLHLRPFVYLLDQSLNMRTLAREYAENRGREALRQVVHPRLPVRVVRCAADRHPPVRRRRAGDAAPVRHRQPGPGPVLPQRLRGRHFPDHRPGGRDAEFRPGLPAGRRLGILRRHLRHHYPAHHRVSALHTADPAVDGPQRRPARPLVADQDLLRHHHRAVHRRLDRPGAHRARAGARPQGRRLCAGGQDLRRRGRPGHLQTPVAVGDKLPDRAPHSWRSRV